MADSAELVEYVDIVEALVVAEVVEVANVVGATLMFDKVKETDAVLAETGLAESEPITIEEMAKLELLDTGLLVDIEVAAEIDVDSFKAAAMSDSSKRYSNVPQPSPS